MESFRTRQTSGLTGGDSTESVDQEETSSLVILLLPLFLVHINIFF